MSSDTVSSASLASATSGLPSASRYWKLTSLSDSWPWARVVVCWPVSASVSVSIRLYTESAAARPRCSGSLILVRFLIGDCIAISATMNETKSPAVSAPAWWRSSEK